MLEKHDVSSKMQNVLIKGDRTCSGLQFTFSLRRVVLCARPCTCDAGRASWNSVYDVLLNIVIPCLHTVIQCLILFVSFHVLGCHDVLFDLCWSIPHSEQVGGARLRFLALASSKPILCRLYCFGRPAFCGSSGGYRRKGSCRSLRVYM